MLVACKGLAYSLSLSGFRGGPIFPGMFIGAVAGIALSHLPGLPMIAGVAMGIGAMTAAMLGLPLTPVCSVAVPAGRRAGLMPLVIVPWPSPTCVPPGSRPRPRPPGPRQLRLPPER